MVQAENYDIEWTPSDVPPWAYVLLTKNYKTKKRGPKGGLRVIEGDLLPDEAPNA